MIEKRFKSRLNKDIKKFHALNPVWDNKLETAWNVFELIDLLNKYDKEYLDCHNDVLRLEKENEQLKEENYELKQGIIDYSQYLTDKSTKLEEENEQLKSENNKLKKENEELQQELFESEYECIAVHYHDNEVRRDDRIEMLKDDFKERFGRDFE